MSINTIKNEKRELIDRAGIEIQEAQGRFAWERKVQGKVVEECFTSYPTPQEAEEDAYDAIESTVLMDSGLSYEKWDDLEFEQKIRAVRESYPS